jgi:hypothetical protein
VKDYQMPQSPCPYCKYGLDAVTPIKDQGPPEEGDATICAKCGNWAVFKADHTLREMTEEDIAALPNEIFNALALASRALAEAKRDMAQIAKFGGKAKARR